jgi:uncharacterized protein YvpB
VNQNARRLRATTSPRKSPPLVIWLFLGLLLLVIAALLITAQITWQRTREVQSLQEQLAQLHLERQTIQAQVAALQGTATVMEDRVAVLEANDPAQQLAALQSAVETANDSEELVALQASMAEIQATVDAFQSTLDELGGRLGALEPEAGDLPAEGRIVVERQRQSHNLSCESSAASMVAAYHGLPLSEAEVLNALPRNADPNLGFRGNVDGPTGGIEDYGVYAGPIMDVLNAQDLNARPVEGGLAGIQAAIARNNPVIAWVTYNCLPSTPTTTTIDGRQVILVPNQHVVVVTGYNAEGVWANDPWDGQEDFYSYADLERAMGYFGQMAIEVSRP